MLSMGRYAKFVVMFPAPHESQIPKIVIIDDDHFSALMLASLLKKEGFILLKAITGPEGRKMVAEQQPDLVLLDVRMPGENGLETCIKLKLDNATAEIPVIFLTGDEDMETKLDGFKAGAVDYVTKPFHSAEVIARIRVHIQARRALALLAEDRVPQLRRLALAQQAILPSPSQFPGARFAPVFRPMHDAGGDFYDVLQPGEDIHDYVVADVSGHDADATLVTSALKVLLYQGQITLSSPLATLRMINSAIRATFGERFFLSLAWVRLNRNRQTLTIIMAGHPPVLLLRAGTDTLETFVSSGDVLGIFDAVHLEETECPVAPGDRLLLFTDGLIELPQADGRVSQTRGLERLMAAALAHRRLPLDEAAAAIVDSLTADAGKVADDILLLAVEV
jgi:sigma-B regulation protein RsbU (phosphoserine phosphatase)